MVLVVSFVLWSKNITRYSINSLFSELYMNFGEACLEVCETIPGGIWEVFGGTVKDNYPDNSGKQSEAYDNLI